MTMAAMMSVSTVEDITHTEDTMEKEQAVPPGRRFHEMQKLIRDIADGWEPNPKQAAKRLLEKHGQPERAPEPPKA